MQRRILKLRPLVAKIRHDLGRLAARASAAKRVRQIDRLCQKYPHQLLDLKKQVKRDTLRGLC